MLKVHYNEIKPLLKKLRFLIFLTFTFLIGFYFSSFIIGSIPAVLILLFLLFEKHILKTRELKKFTNLDILVTAILYGYLIGFILLILIFIFQ